jgi:uncharacterized UBP type Zn finger protein
MTLDMKGMARLPRSGGPNGQAPRCDHADTIRPAEAQSPGCTECLASGQRWVRLLVCPRCGWVACSDDSPGAHARAHYEETDHPVAGALEPGSTWRWCYVHGRAV